MSKKLLVSFFKITFIGSILYWLISSGHLDFDKILSLMSLKIFSICVGLAFLNIITNGLRWWVLICAKDFNLGWRELIRLQFMGYFFNFVMPGSVGGDLVKGYYLVKSNSDRKTDAATTILLDRVVGLYVMLGISIVTVGIFWEKIFSKPLFSALASTLIAGFVGVTVLGGLGLVLDGPSLKLLKKVLDPLPLGKKVYSVFESMFSYKKNMRALVLALLLSVVSQLFIIANFLVVGEMALFEGLSLDTYFFAVPLGMVSTALPVAPAGIGVGQGVYLALFHGYTGASPSVGQIGITVFQLALFINSLIGGYFYLTIKGKLKEELKEVA